MRSLVFHHFKRCGSLSVRSACASPSQPVMVASLVEGVRRQFRTYSPLLEKSDKESDTWKSQEDIDDEEEEKRKEEREKIRKYALSTEVYFDSKKRNKETFEVMLDVYNEKNPNKRGVVEFILAAINHMDDYNVQYDLATYKKLIQLLPEGKYVPENIWQEEFYHYPKQQECIITLLDRMERKGVCPDLDMLHIVSRIFGPKSHPCRKIGRQLYWFPKFKNASPWPVPFPPITDRFALAKLAIERIVSVDPQSEVSVYETKSIPDAIDDTFVVSGQSPTQKKLIEEHPRTQSLYVEGAFLIWVGRSSVNYFILRADPKKFEENLDDPDDISKYNIPFAFEPNKKKVFKKPSVHEQEDSTIMAVCATGSSSRDALLSWIRLLELNGNSALADIPIIFSLKSPLGDMIPPDSDGPIPTPEDEPRKVTES